MKLKHLGCVAAFAASVAGAQANAAVLQFVYTGRLSAPDSLALASGGPDLVTGPTAFRLTARFDPQGPDIAPPFLAGLAAFRPLSARFTIGGVLYTIDTAQSDFAIAFFDRDNMFGPRNSGRYAAGWIVEADVPPMPFGIGDGPGIVGDYLSASPDFTVDNIVPTTFTNFQGAGFAEGPGCGIFPTMCNIVPLHLIGPDRLSYLLQLEGREDEAADGDFIQTAQIVPQPATLALFGLGAIGLARLRRR